MDDDKEGAVLVASACERYIKNIMGDKNERSEDR